MITEKTEISKGIYDVILHAPQIAEKASAGQFINILCDGYTLRRPISICEIDKPAGNIRIVFEVKGGGTKWLAGLNTDGCMDIFGPLGHGFTVNQNKKTILVGGGIGVPPLLEISRRVRSNATALLGFRSKDSKILARDFKIKGSKVLITTDDGSEGFHGYVTTYLEQLLLEQLLTGKKYDIIQACGPKPMLKAISVLADKYNIPCEISMEQRMACGVGACLVCACKTKAENQGGYTYSHVCKDGPVFDSKEVVW